MESSKSGLIAIKPTRLSLNVFTFPPHYSFPPFFTLQPNLTTRNSQFASWKDLILKYASTATPRSFRMTPSHPIFTNEALCRTLTPSDAVEVLKYMVEHQRAAWLDTGTARFRRGVDDRLGAEKAVVWLFWHSLDEWAHMISAWADETGQKNIVLTFYELFQGDSTIDQEFHDMPLDFAKLVIAVLVRRSKAQILGDDEAVGVKFF